MIAAYGPTDRQELPSWAKTHKESVAKAAQRLRAIQIIEALSRHPKLKGMVTVKGAAALWLFFGNPRAVSEIEIVYRNYSSARELEEGRDELIDAVRQAVSSVPGSRFSSDLVDSKKPRTIQVEITPNRYFYTTLRAHIHRGKPVAVLSPDCILADKLYAILQTRPVEGKLAADVYDVCYMTKRKTHPLRMRMVRKMYRQRLTEEGLMWRSAKRKLAEVASTLHAGDYLRHALENTSVHIPFAEAWSALEDLCRLLDEP